MSFLQKLLGLDGVTQLQVTNKYGISSTGCAHVIQYPMYMGASGGSFSMGQVSGTMAAGLGAASEIFHFRWASASANAVVRSVKFSAVCAGTAFAVGLPTFTLTIARSWSADGTGGTAVTIGGNNNKRRATFASSQISAGHCRIATTAALTTGTKTLDGNSIATILGANHTSTAGEIVPAGTFFWGRDTSDEYPVLLTQNEGLVIRASVPITGTWGFAVCVEWAELALTDF